ncbi:TetR/AcrR family transcriptional regulator [Pseudomonas aeruginosa]|uniref:TetR/AcrR family transcriptional regulator n=1 Tax=Pseudomonas TaxID=286 RepID=UPI001FFC5E98|nr:TetR/AcrR family transcriptional regulator [Pseudomonas sp. PNPG3]MCK2119964.1 TetR/AcrR family transcriptional regulator [Pseudomonas sp. PNPG3]
MPASPDVVPLDARGRILKAAFDLLAREGSAAVTAKAIAEAADVAISTLYLSFDDKESIVVEAIEYGTRLWLGNVHPLPAPSADLAVSVVAAIRTITQDLLTSNDFWRIGLLFALSNPGTGALRVSDLRTQTFGEVAGWWRSALDRVGLQASKQQAKALALLLLSSVGAIQLAGRADAHFIDEIPRITARLGSALSSVAMRLVTSPNTIYAADSRCRKHLISAVAPTAPTKEHKRDLILSSTLSLLAHEGYRNTTIARITKEAGVSSSSIYWICPNKEELLQHAIDWAADDWYSTVPPFLPIVDASGWVTRFIDQIDHYLASNLRSPQFLLAGLQLILENYPDGPPEALHHMTRIRATARSRMAAWLKDVATGFDESCITAAELALFISALLDETFSLHFVNQETGIPPLHVQLIGRLVEALTEPAAD